MYNYFPHPSNLRQSSECVSLLIEEGFAGYGLYLAILEVLRDAPGYRYSPDPKVWRYILHADNLDQLQRVLTSYGLFDRDDNGLLFSPWLCEQLEAYSDKKAKLAEAGRRGALKRWASSKDKEGQAIANPSMEDGQAIAYNIMKPNITLRNVTLPDPSVGKVVDVAFFEKMISSQPEGHAPGYVAQVCMKYGMKEETCLFICEHSENAKVTNSVYKAFSAIVRRIEAEKFTPKYPDSFFMSKLFEK